MRPKSPDRLSFSLLRITFVLIACASIILGCDGDQPTPRQVIEENVTEGMIREDALKIAGEVLDGIAWYHVECPQFETRMLDLYFYGSNSFDSAQLLIVSSELSDGGFIVTGAGEGSEPYIWQRLYQECYDPEVFDRYHEVAPFPID